MKSRFGDPFVRTPILLRVAAVVIVNVTVIVLLVAPMSTDPNPSIGGGGVGGVLIISTSWVAADKAPEVPVMVMVAVPTVAELLAIKVSWLVPVVDVGLNDAVTPEGNPDAVKLTLPTNPPASVTETTAEPEVPW